jgi:hypothetical protein
MYIHIGNLNSEKSYHHTNNMNYCSIINYNKKRNYVHKDEDNEIEDWVHHESDESDSDEDSEERGVTNQEGTDIKTDNHNAKILDLSEGIGIELIESEKNLNISDMPQIRHRAPSMESEV